MKESVEIICPNYPSTTRLDKLCEFVHNSYESGGIPSIRLIIYSIVYKSVLCKLVIDFRPCVLQGRRTERWEKMNSSRTIVDQTRDTKVNTGKVRSHT